VAVAILSSGYEDNYINTMVAALESVTDLPSPQAMPYAEVDRTTFDNHVGTYDAGFMTIEVTNNNGTINVRVPELDAQGTSYSRFLDPLGGNTFLANSEGEMMDVTFFSAASTDSENSESVYMRNRNWVAINLKRAVALPKLFSLSKI
jgi:hypothetical protein